jgi:hypothetical protein
MTETNETIAVKDMLSAASPLIKSLVETFVTPKLVAFRDKFKSELKITDLPSESNFTEYFYRTYKKLAVINTLVFNNSQRLLNDIFVPLTLVSTNDKKIKIKVSGFPQKISDEFGNILVTDTAGMGKSTLMKTIFIDSINSNRGGIPIFIELRRLTAEKKVVNEIQEQLNSINKNFDEEILLKLLAEGVLLLFLMAMMKSHLKTEISLQQIYKNLFPRLQIIVFLSHRDLKRRSQALGIFRNSRLSP